MSPNFVFVESVEVQEGDAAAEAFAQFLLDTIRRLALIQLSRRLQEVRALRASAESELEILLDEETRLVGILARMPQDQYRQNIWDSLPLMRGPR